MAKQGTVYTSMVVGKHLDSQVWSRRMGCGFESRSGPDFSRFCT